MNQLAEQRKNPRKRCLIPIHSKEGTAFDHTEAVDISAEGIGIVSEKKISVNEKIGVEIDLDDKGRSVVMIGEVKWVTPIPNSNCYRVGMKLVRND